jgi:hypothetical protein
MIRVDLRMYPFYLKLGSISARKVSDHLPSKEREELNPRDLYQYVCKTECWNVLCVALARLLAAKPH